MTDRRPGGRRIQWRRRRSLVARRTARWGGQDERPVGLGLDRAWTADRANILRPTASACDRSRCGQRGKEERRGAAAVVGRWAMRLWWRRRAPGALGCWRGVILGHGRAGLQRMAGGQVDVISFLERGWTGSTMEIQRIGETGRDDGK